ncbi:MAG: hypothetical protein RR740_22355, partial [Pseudomonas sp.]
GVFRFDCAGSGANYRRLESAVNRYFRFYRKFRKACLYIDVRGMNAQYIAHYLQQYPALTLDDAAQ